MKDGKHITLGIESSCDETAVAVMADGRKMLSNIISSQIDIHKDFGGVVPEIASRHHLTNINSVIEKAMSEADVTPDDIDLIGVTKGPGLVGALLIGIATAKALALAWDKPMTGVHHIQGHISAAFVENPDLKPPFMALVVSGGHTEIVRVEDYDSFRVLGSTRDDAAGEAFDKVARVLGLGYPGGPLIDRIAKEGDPEAVQFKRVFLEKGSLDFSFSGIKTAVLNYINSQKQADRPVCTEDVAAGFQQAVLDVIVAKAVSAAAEAGEDKIIMAGGVAANSRLREMMEDACSKKGIRLYVPSPILCTDNGAMIGCAAYNRAMKGHFDGLDMDAFARLDIENA